ncbi:MAG: hypothetical protein H5T50_02570 [Nitrososphaeria archaeon]|nr:hypothetical protein [Nitrososphaeria archaeon]
MNIKLDDLELVKREDKDGVILETRSIINVTLSNRRQVYEIKVPGYDGSVFQDFGRYPVTIVVEGLLTGPNSKNTFKDLSSKFRLGKPVQFVSDIPSITEVSEVVIESFRAAIVSSSPTSYWYILVLKEHKSVKQEEKEAPSQEETAKEETESMIKEVYDMIRKEKGK